MCCLEWVCDLDQFWIRHHKACWMWSSEFLGSRGSLEAVWDPQEMPCSVGLRLIFQNSMWHWVRQAWILSLLRTMPMFQFLPWNVDSRFLCPQIALMDPELVESSLGTVLPELWKFPSNLCRCKWSTPQTSWIALRNRWDFSLRELIVSKAAAVNQRIRQCDLTSFSFCFLRPRLLIIWAQSRVNLDSLRVCQVHTCRARIRLNLFWTKMAIWPLSNLCMPAFIQVTWSWSARIGLDRSLCLNYVAEVRLDSLPMGWKVCHAFRLGIFEPSLSSFWI